MVRRFAGLFALAALCLPAQQPDRMLRMEEGGERRALVIGNDKYPGNALKNPSHDAQAMGEALRSCGFTADVVIDADLKTFSRAIDRFIGSLHSGDVAFFYYAGHGIQIQGENYLVPIDFAAKDEAEAPYEAYSVSRLHDRMEATGSKLNLIVLDACRNNPYKATRSAGGGLAAMNSGRGTFIAFATAPGKTASDNPNGSNGLYTTYLVQALRTPGLTLDETFNFVRQHVYEASNERQLPWVGSSVIGEFYFVPPQGGAPARPAASIAVAPPPPQPAAATRQAAVAESSNDNLDQLEDDFIKLSARAESVRASVDRLAAAQQQSGLGLSARIAGPRQLMDSYLKKAETALKEKDSARAKQNLELADQQVSILEKRFNQ